MIVLLPEKAGITWKLPSNQSERIRSWAAKKNSLQWKQLTLFMLLVIVVIIPTHVGINHPTELVLAWMSALSLVEGARFWDFLPTKAFASRMTVILLLERGLILSKLLVADLVCGYQLCRAWRRSGMTWSCIGNKLLLILMILYSIDVLLIKVW